MSSATLDSLEELERLYRDHALVPPSVVDEGRKWVGTSLGIADQPVLVAEGDIEEIIETPAVVTIPVALVAWFQWGWTPPFFYLMLAYLIIQALDGNLLVPLLFSEVVNIHPIAIIVAILFFGGLWGFWGVFFAIPLATLVQAVIRVWPQSERPPPPEASAS